MQEYRVELDIYNGPLDLLLFLIHRDEIDIYDIPIARITEQFVGYVEILKQIDPEIIGDFLVLAATLMEIKSRALLPTPPPEEEDGEFIDPRLELVRQLLEYKTYKDAARSMELSAQVQALRHPREPVLPDAGGDEIDLEDVEVWDLLEAFSKLLEETGRRTAPHHIQTDDTPLLVYLDEILERLDTAGGTMKFAMFFADRTKAQMIGLFLAMLELIRQRRIRAAQDAPFGEIVVILLDATPVDEAVDDYGYADPSRDSEEAVDDPSRAREEAGDDPSRAHEEAVDDPSRAHEEADDDPSRAGEEVGDADDSHRNQDERIRDFRRGDSQPRRG